MKEMFKNRYKVLSAFFTIAMVMIFFQLFNLQILNGKEYDEISKRRLLRETDIKPSRGNIIDRNGVPLAVNRMSFTVDIAKTGVPVNELNDMIFKLVAIFEKNNEVYANSLSKYLTTNPIEYGSNIKQSEVAINKWENEMVMDSKEKGALKTPYDIFMYFRKKKFKISDSYTDEQAYKIISIRYEMLIKGCTSFNSLVLAKDVSAETIAEIEERSFEFPGVAVHVEPQRKYLDGENLAHVIGYISNISPEEYQELKGKGYSMNDKIGKSGVELKAESYLKGNVGKERVGIDVKGKQMQKLVGISAKDGDNVVLTIDSKLQDIAVESLRRNIDTIKSRADYRKNFGDAFAGSVVALDINTGEILVMANYPSFDPSIYLANPDDKEAQRKKQAILTDSENTPLLNRAIQGEYIPGSIYKPIPVIAGLEEGIITSDTLIQDKGVEVIGGRKFYCLEYRLGLGTHGHLDLVRALATSCNMFFYNLGVKVGIDNIDKWAKYFGLGELTGIDLGGERDGIRANKETKFKLRKDIWRPADTAQVAIGQFDNAFTPIQIANYVSSIANGGKRYTPYLIKKIMSSGGDIIFENKPSYQGIPVSEETIAAVKKGMKAVTNSSDGTAVSVFGDFPFTVAGKTGTPETGSEYNHSSNGLFICYAPADNPKIAVAVVIERGVWGANVAPVARDILCEYFGLNSAKKVKDGVALKDTVEFVQ